MITTCKIRLLKYSNCSAIFGTKMRKKWDENDYIYRKGHIKGQNIKSRSRKNECYVMKRITSHWSQKGIHSVYKEVI